MDFFLFIHSFPSLDLEQGCGMGTGWSGESPGSDPGGGFWLKGPGGLAGRLILVFLSPSWSLRGGRMEMILFCKLRSFFGCWWWVVWWRVATIQRGQSLAVVCQGIC